MPTKLCDAKSRQSLVHRCYDKGLTVIGQERKKLILCNTLRLGEVVASVVKITLERVVSRIQIRERKYTTGVWFNKKARMRGATQCNAHVAVR